MSSRRTALAVCGPTASGKSALGIALAKALSGEVVNVDSVQVYQGVDIGAAKVSLQERAEVPHHLLDLCPPTHQMNAAEYRDAAIRVLDDISQRGRLPVLVGGSGMYLTILLHGIAEVPATTPEVRQAVADLSREEQYAELQRVDPITAARLHVNDTQRISRALEIFRLTGKGPSEIFQEHQFGVQDIVALMIVICRERDDLYDRINRRAHEMVDRGLVDETRQLLERYGDVPVLQTLGYKQARDLLQGRLAAEQLATEIALYTRRFAKRQMTYLRNEPAKRGWTMRPASDEPGREILGFTTDSRRALERTKGFRAMEVCEEELARMVRERLSQPLERTEVWYVHLR